MAALPNGIIVPFMGIDIDPSQAGVGPTAFPMQKLIFGQKLAAGTMDVDTPYLVSSADEVAELAGIGSMLHRGAIQNFKKKSVVPTYIMALTDAAGTSATTDLTVVGTATEDGTIFLLVDGESYQVPVSFDDDETDIAEAIVAEINDNPAAACVATNVAGVVTLTAKNKGVAAGDIEVLLNYNQGEFVPAGVAITIAATTPGTVDPDVQDVLDNIGDYWFPVLVSTYNDATSLESIEDYLVANADPLVMKHGKYYCAKKDTRANLITFSTNTARNNPWVSLIAATNQPNTNMEVACNWASLAAESALDHCAVPLHRQTMVGLKAALPSNRWTVLERNQLATNGISTIDNSAFGGPQIEATVSMYLKNISGVSAVSMQQDNTMFQLMYLVYTFRTRVLTKFARALLADNADTITDTDKAVLTENVGRGEAIAWFLELQGLGIVEKADQFIEEVRCKRSTTNPNRMEWLLPPDLINQFIVGAATMQFRLQSST